MFKKILQVLAASALLYAAYNGYVHAFAIVASQAAPSRKPLQTEGVARKRSASDIEATELAVLGFGADSWQADPNLGFRYYQADQGYWLYAKTQERMDDGRKMIFRPFSMVWRSKDGKTLKTASSEKAEIILDKPVGMTDSGGGAKILRAAIMGDVRLRDNKGTAAPGDDLKIELTHANFDQASLTIVSDSFVSLRDSTMLATGMGLDMKLRAKAAGGSGGSSGGFDGAETIKLLRTVHIIMKDVGNSGFLSGPAKPAPRATPAAGASGAAVASATVEVKAAAKADKKAAPTPLDLRSDGELQIDMPKPIAKVAVGPPEPPRPIIAQFHRSVVVVRGNVAPDQLNCDYLRLELVPGPDDPAAAPKEQQFVADAARGDEPAVVADAEAAGEGSGSGMDLREAMATGHAVWIQSPAQGLRGKGNQLIFKKKRRADDPDETYFRGDTAVGMWLEKTEVAKKDGADADAKKPAAAAGALGKSAPGSVTTILAVDATIFERAPVDEVAGSQTVIARGPGRLETRPAKDKPVDRTSLWQDRLEMVTTGEGQSMLRKVTLTRFPKFIQAGVPDKDGVDPGPTTLASRKSITVWLVPSKPKPKSAAPKPAATAVASADPSASEGDGGAGADAAKADEPEEGGFRIQKLAAIDDAHLTAPRSTTVARERLDAVFDEVEAKPVVVAEAPPPPPDAGPAAPVVQEMTPVVEAKPPDPATFVTADRVFARIVQEAGSGGGDIRVANLRGASAFHQDPAPFKTEATDAVGEAIDLHKGEDKLIKLLVSAVDPNAPPRSSLAAKLGGPAGPSAAAPAPRARVAAGPRRVEGPLIGLDQAADKSWVVGAGTLTEIGRKDVTPPPPTDDERKALRARRDPMAAWPFPEPRAAEESPLVIDWTDRMTFFGRGDGKEGPPGFGKAIFLGTIRANSADSSMACEASMTAYLDGPVSFARSLALPGGKAAAPPPGQPEPKAQIDKVVCVKDVEIVNVKRDPATGLVIEKQRIVDPTTVTYTRSDGNLDAPESGVVYLYARDDGTQTGAGPADPARPAEARTAGRGARVTPVSARAKDGEKDAKGSARATDVPLTLTQIAYQNGFHGKLGSGGPAPAAGAKPAGPRQADFFREVQALHAPVADENAVIDPDRPPVKFTMLTSNSMRVLSYPPPAETPKAPARTFLNAWDDALARTDTESIVADVIRYDSSKELFTAYANPGNTVKMTQQTAVGQPPSVTPGRAMLFNKATGERQVVGAGDIQFLNQAVGGRPVKNKVLPDPKQAPLRNPKFRAPGATDKERRGFTGSNF